MAKNNPEITRRYYYKNRDRILEVRRHWEFKNKDRINKARRERNKVPEYNKKTKDQARNNYWKHREKRLEYFQKHKKERNLYARNNNKQIKLEVLNYYSNGIMNCNCCGEKEIHFLSIDHIDGGGRKLSNIQGTGTGLYKWLRRNEFPKGFQVLCMNCNFAKGKIGVCPHKLKNPLEVKI